MTLLSIPFFAVAGTAIVLLPLLRGRLRWWLLFGLSVIYVQSYMRPVGLLSTALFLLAGYGVARWARGGSRLALPLGLTLLTLGFVYMRDYSLLKVLLPDWRTDALVTAGLSFLFFKMVHVAVDSASGTVGQLRLSTYLLYCVNFTAFLLGPIQRYQDFDEQWSGRRPSIEPGFEPRLDAFNRMLRGLVKKFVLAEALSPLVINPEMAFVDYGSLQLLLRLYLFYFYLYFDFSGYCDIVIGVGRLMGVRPPENFYLPFLSRNVSEYWLRVHRSLTLWLTDYIFTPSYAYLLRRPWMRSRAFLALCAALLLTMFVSGLWHGTTLRFVYFGLFHGVFLVTARVYERLMIRLLGRKRFGEWTRNRVVHVAAVFLTFNATSLAYAFFVLDVDRVIDLLRRILG